MSIEPWLHFAHIGAAMIWVGGGVVLMMVGLRVRRSGDVAFMSEFARTLSYVGLRVLTPAVVVVLASGIWLVLQQSRSFGELWILLALGAFALAFLIGAVFLSRNAIALERLATGANADAPRAREALDRWIFGYLVVLALLVFTLWDMIFKPGL
jgi:uncharacterized membrane protein